MAGRGGFEPPEVLPSPVFKTGAFNRSAISRHYENFVKFWRRHPDLNRGSELCRLVPYHLAISPFRVKSHILLIKYMVVPGAGFEPAHPNGRGILSPLRLPVSPSGQRFTSFLKEMERETRFELATPTLARSCSTTELFPHLKKS